MRAEKTPETWCDLAHHVPGRVLMDATMTSLITTSVHSRPIPMNKCILAVNFAQESPEDPKRLFSEPTTLHKTVATLGVNDV